MPPRRGTRQAEDEPTAELGSDHEEAAADDSDASGEGEEASSSDGGSSSDGDDSDGSSEDGSDEDEERPRKRKKRASRPFVAPPPREMPARTTRGLRMGALAAADAPEGGDAADAEFWGQDFFAEEAADEVYATESEPEDRFDADFLASDNEDSAGGGGDVDEEAEDDARAREARRRALKPPGHAAAAAAAAAKRRAAAAARDRAAGKAPAAAAAPPPPAARRAPAEPEIPFESTITVRRSTKQKGAEAEEERRAREAAAPRRAARAPAHRPLTQAELLAEAARTEIENTRSLEALMAVEEAIRRRAGVKKARYAGPLLRLRSRRVGGEELTTLEVRNMQAPAEYSRRAAPPPPPRALCAVTGAPARYRDPLTGLPYADAAAFAELRRRAASVAATSAAAAAEVAATEAARQEAELAARPRYRAW